MKIRMKSLKISNNVKFHALPALVGVLHQQATHHPKKTLLSKLRDQDRKTVVGS
jgi:hypothetical protein